MMRRNIGMILALAAVAACGPGRLEGPSADLTPPLNEAFSLRVGQSATFLEPALVIRFAGVPVDSRCPIDVQCIWAGDAVARLEFHVGPPDGKGPDFRVDLHTTLEPRTAPWGPYYEIRLLSLAPQPTSGQPRPDGYRATLVVESR